MNSRDAAYDEDEMLRRAIEESRDTGSLGKRTRDDSEEYDFTTPILIQSMADGNS